MRFRFLVLTALWLLAGHAVARADDRPVTEEERAKLSAAVQAEGCSGGSMEADDDGYEVENATCADGRTYELEFDKSFRLIEKELED
jgi:hypothetical protein